MHHQHISAPAESWIQETLTQGTIIANRYLIRRQIGRGGMGWVYLAWDLSLRAHVAVKQLHVAEANRELGLDLALQLFRREAAVQGQLLHPFMPRLFAECRDRQGYFIVMEYITGPPLGHVLEQDDLTLAERWRFAQQICYLVEYLHSLPRPVLHADLSINHFIVRDGQAVLIDFGLARFLGDHSLDHLRLAKEWYSPPEQCTGQPLDQRADIHALGQTLSVVLGSWGRTGPLHEVLARATDPLIERRHQSVRELRRSVHAAVLALESSSALHLLGSGSKQHADRIILASRSHHSANYVLRSGTHQRRRRSGADMREQQIALIMLTIALLGLLLLVFTSLPIKPLPLHQPSPAVYAAEPRSAERSRTSSPPMVGQHGFCRVSYSHSPILCQQSALAGSLCMPEYDQC